jgi:hypothetical protein
MLEIAEYDSVVTSRHPLTEHESGARGASIEAAAHATPGRGAESGSESDDAESETFSPVLPMDMKKIQTEMIARPRPA